MPDFSLKPKSYVGNILGSKTPGVSFSLIYHYLSIGFFLIFRGNLSKIHEERNGFIHPIPPS